MDTAVFALPFLVFLYSVGAWVHFYFILGLIFDTGIILYIPDFGLSVRCTE